MNTGNQQADCTLDFHNYSGSTASVKRGRIESNPDGIEGDNMILFTFQQDEKYCLGVKTEQGILDIAAANRVLSVP